MNHWQDSAVTSTPRKIFRPTTCLFFTSSKIWLQRLCRLCLHKQRVTGKRSESTGPEVMRTWHLQETCFEVFVQPSSVLDLLVGKCYMHSCSTSFCLTSFERNPLCLMQDCTETWDVKQSAVSADNQICFTGVFLIQTKKLMQMKPVFTSIFSYKIQSDRVWYRTSDPLLAVFSLFRRRDIKKSLSVCFLCLQNEV